MGPTGPGEAPVPPCSAARAVHILATLPIVGWAVWLMPGPTLADTGSPPPFVPPVEDPVRDLTSTVTTVGAIVLTLVGIIGGIALAGALLARVGGPAIAGRGRQMSVRPRSTIGWVAFGVVLIVAAGVGILTGRGMAYYSSVGGLTALTSGILGLALVLTAVVLTIVAAIGRRRRKAMSPAIASLLMAAGLLPIGAGFGAWTAGITGGTYREPVFLEASGSASVELTTADLDFTPTTQGSARCGSVADGTDVAQLTALDLGELAVDGASGTLRGEVGKATGDHASAGISLWIDGGDLVDGSFQPFWEGSGVVVQVSSGGTTGTVQFSALGISELPDSSMASVNWPATLSGSIQWSCAAW